MAKYGENGFKKGQSGNPNGRPRGTNEIQQLRDAMKRAARRNKVDLIDHFCNTAYIDSRVLVALMKKILPDKKESDVAFTGELDVIMLPGKVEKGAPVSTQESRFGEDEVRELVENILSLRQSKEGKKQP